jgi:hypothetical protein
MPTKMMAAPDTVSTRPAELFPSKNRRPQPTTRGSSERPKVWGPNQPQKPVLTVTWLVSR